MSKETTELNRLYRVEEKYNRLKAAVDKYIGWAGCHACSSNKTGNNPEACKDCEIKEFEAAMSDEE